MSRETLFTDGAICRYSVHISINGKVTTADMVWLEQQFGTRGYTMHIAKMSIHCHVADFQSAFPLVISPPLPCDLPLLCQKDMHDHQGR